MFKQKRTREERFWAHVTKGPDCWLWTGSTSEGYGYLSVEGKHQYAHRIAYEISVGPIPEGLVIDHVRARGCTNRNCVNPAHLEAVTQGENARRGLHPKGQNESLKADNARRREATHCKHGHEFTLKNTRHDKVGNERHCRTCEARRTREYLARKKQAA